MGRIISYDEKNGYNDGDYLLLDNGEGGTKRIRADRVGIQLDPTLSKSGQAADAKVVGDDLHNITGCERLQVTAKKKYINLAGTSVVMSDGTPQITENSSSYDLTLVPCAAGDIFTINGTGGTSPRLWGFVSSTGQILAVANASATATELVLQAPESSAWLIVNDNSNSASYKGEPTKKSIQRLEDLTEKVQSVAVTDGISGEYVGVTFSNSNGKLKMSGTCSTARRILFLNGQFASKILSSAFEKTLDAGTYVFETDLTGYSSDIRYSIRATYTTFNNEFFVVDSKEGKKAVVTFTEPVMIGFLVSENRDFGTEDNPTYLSCIVKKVTAIDYIARKNVYNLNEDLNALQNVVKSDISLINYIDDWIQGTINTSNGTIGTSTTRCRSGYIQFDWPFPLATIYAEGFKISIREYTDPVVGTSEEISSAFVKSSDWGYGKIDFELNPNHWYRVVIAYTDDSTILPENINASSVWYPSYKNCNDVVISKLNTKTIVPSIFYQGGFNGETGGVLSSNTMVRNYSYLMFPTQGSVKVNVKEGYKTIGYKFRANFTDNTEAIEAYDSQLSSGWITNKWSFKPNDSNRYYYRFAVAKIDDSNLTPNDVPTNVLTFEFDSGEGVPTKWNIADNSVLGNVTIRAAKTINFDDGTPPYTDWYLLQDTCQNFYMSKDLKSRKYLFTFFQPSSTLSAWSCGIDAYNNIIFVKDASGYTDSDGPRLDDSKRVNPIYFLSSENYSIMHVLDFGDSFKPAGWLQNVGWCILPNNNVIMCEYTRGTLATCNVWCITGSVADKNNWHKVWSHEIVDSTSATVKEMKHCHCTQYDFYANIAYFTTGDGSESSYIYYSKDYGMTWTLLYGPNRDKCRLVTFAFTSEYVYWASDSFDAADKHFFIAERDSTGLIDVANATSINLPEINSQACYGCVYLEELNIVLMMDRADLQVSNPLTLKAYDINSSEIITIADIPIATLNRNVGFRTKYVDWYPTGSNVLVGFNPEAGGGTSDVNNLKVCGNLGAGSNIGEKRVNSITIHLYKKNSERVAIRFTPIAII